MNPVPWTGVMLRRVAVIALLAGVFAAPAKAAPIRGQTLMPGVVYSRQLEFTAHGPVVVHVISAPKPVGGLYQLKPVLSNNAILGRERVTAMQRAVSPVATVAGVNGDLFSWRDGHPTGALIRSGVLDSTPSADRSSIGIDTDGMLHVERLAMAGTWKGTGQRRQLDVNEPATTKRTTLYTSAWGPRTPTEGNAVEATLLPFPATTPNKALTAPITQVVQGGNQPIPPGGAVLVARNDGQFLTQEAPVGTTVSVTLLLTPPWANVTDAIGGGPAIVRNGKPVFRSFELFTDAQLAGHSARTAVGQTADGRVLLVAVDGQQPGYSTGLTNFELALLMMRLGAVTASALDSGGSTTMAFDGKLLNRPSDAGGERAVAEALLVFYYGVYAPALADPVLSPNGDGTADSESFSYKLVRPSTVTASLVGPGGAAIPLDSGRRDPGVYRFSWAGRNPDGSSASEGKWTFSVAASDDQGRQSTSERQFSLNTTLGFLAARADGTRMTATFKLARPARIATRIETPSGAIVRTLPGRSLNAGTAATSWRGRSGRYVLSVTATNEIGSVEQTAPFVLGRG
jgi:flagellar hook assembly protein FlgD